MGRGGLVRLVGGLDDVEEISGSVENGLPLNIVEVGWVEDLRGRDGSLKARWSPSLIDFFTFGVVAI